MKKIALAIAFVLMVAGIAKAISLGGGRLSTSSGISLGSGNGITVSKAIEGGAEPEAAWTAWEEWEK